MHLEENLTSIQIEINEIFSSYLSMLLATSNPVGIESCIRAIPTYIIEEHNRSLNAEFTEQEVKKALLMMSLLGAPGPDDFF